VDLQTPQTPTPQSPYSGLYELNAAGSSRLARWNDATWRDDAACAGMDTRIFFPIGETGPAARQVTLAKAACAACPVRDECLEFAIATIQNDGVWGGTTEDERRLIKRSRRAKARRAAAQTIADEQAQPSDDNFSRAS
jgi:WhiB family transcriptional regulator, redox-sensing transcriptional regulator